MFRVLKTGGRARRGGSLPAPTARLRPGLYERREPRRPSKGGVSAHDLEKLNCQIELSNTYHLHVRPGDDVVKQMEWSA